MSSQEFDFEHFKSEVLKSLYAGKPLTGKDGVLGALIENLLDTAFEGEMASHMSDEERDSGNRRNGHIPNRFRVARVNLRFKHPSVGLGVSNRRSCRNGNRFWPRASPVVLSGCMP